MYVLSNQKHAKVKIKTKQNQTKLTPGPELDFCPRASHEEGERLHRGSVSSAQGLSLQTLLPAKSHSHWDGQMAHTGLPNLLADLSAFPSGER